MVTKDTQPHDPVSDQIAAECLAGRVRLLGRAITGIYDEALRPLGITAGQLNTLVFIARKGPVAPGVLARRLSMEKSTVSRNLDRMRQHGWVKVSPGAWGNTQLVEIRAKGHSMIKRAHSCWSKAQTRAEHLLGTRGMQAVRRAGKTVAARGLGT